MQLTESEIANWTLTPEHLDEAERELQISGYVIFERVLAPEKVAMLHSEFMEIFNRYVAMIGDNRGKNRQGGVPLPVEGPFADPDIIANRLIIGLLKGILGEEIVCSYFASDTPMPGSEYQPVHRDGRDLFPGVPVTVPPFMYELNIPLVDFREDNGPIEVWPRTHLVNDFTLLPQRRDEIRAGKGGVKVATESGKPGRARLGRARHRRAAVRRFFGWAAGPDACRLVPRPRPEDVASRHAEPLGCRTSDAFPGVRTAVVPVQYRRPPP